MRSICPRIVPVTLTSMWLATLLAASLAGPGNAAEVKPFPTPYNTQAETEPPLSPEAALATIKAPEGFRVTLFAGEPAVQNPIALCTDPRGRLWVAENYSYAEQEVGFADDLRDRIVILEDTDGDGVHDVRKVFWDQGIRLTGIAQGFGGLWATCAPYLLFLPDRNGDDVLDGEPEVILDGFNVNDVRHNIVNGLEWGPDGWLYGRHGIMATSRIGPPGSADSERAVVSCGVWRVHPTTRAVEAVAHGTTNPWGLDWDPQGECWLINTVIGHLWHVVPGAHWERMYGSDLNPYTYELIPQVADHVHWDAVEAWSDIRKGISDSTSSLGGGHAHCGLLMCDRSWPAAYQGSILAGNLHGRRLNRDVLEREGCSYVAHHAPDFLTSGDPYFRVIELEHARDNGFYLADWSDIGECHENDGVHRTSGRVYKVTWPAAGAAGKTPVDLAKCTNAELVALQQRSDEWAPRMARLLLQERATAHQNVMDAHAALDELVKANRDPVEVLRGLWSLHVIDALPAEKLTSLSTSHADEHVRSWALRLLVEQDPAGVETIALLRKLAVNDPSGLVRLYVASSLQRLPLDQRLPIAAALSRHAEDAADRELPRMVWYGMEPSVPHDPASALVVAEETAMSNLRRFIARRLTQELKSRPEGTAAVVAALAKSDARSAGLQRDLLQGMTEALSGWRQAPVPAGWDAARERLSQSTDADVTRIARELSVVFGDGRAVDELRKIVSSRQFDLDTRRSAIRALVEARVEGTDHMLAALLIDRDLGADAVRGLAAVGGADAAGLIVQRYGKLRQLARQEAITTLVSRPDFAPALLDAVAERKIPREDVPPFQLRQMLTYSSGPLTERIQSLWPELQQLSAEKQERIRALAKQLTPQTIAAADVSHGRLLFANACAKCHKLFGEGGTAAPELTGAQRTNLNYLLENIVDPSATISKNYRMSIVVLDDGRVLNGVVMDPTDQTIALQTATDKVVIDRASIEALRETDLSLMPEGQLDRLSESEVRDLIGYLMSPVQVGLPPRGISASE